MAMSNPVASRRCTSLWQVLPALLQLAQAMRLRTPADAAQNASRDSWRGVPPPEGLVLAHSRIPDQKDVSRAIEDLEKQSRQRPHSPTPLLDLLRIAEPIGQPCRCTFERWDRYTLCKESFETATSTWSFGMDGEDPWSFYMEAKHNFVPKTFDCMESKRPLTYRNDFSTGCLGNSSAASLSRLLATAGPRSAIVKLDLDNGAEIGVLEKLTGADFARLASLTVQYSLDEGCPHSAQNLGRLRRTLVRVSQHLTPVNAEVGFSLSGHHGCSSDGDPPPKFLLVTYLSPQTCRSKPLTHARGNLSNRLLALLDESARPEGVPAETKPTLTLCPAHFGNSTRSDNLGMASRTLCTPALAPLMQAWIDDEFQENFKQVYDSSGWVEEAFVNYFGASSKDSPFTKETELLVESVHSFSQKPIIVIDFVGKSSTVPGLTAKRFPRLVLLRALPIPRGVSFNFNKIRAMLLAKVVTGVQLDSDQIVFHGADRMFQRTREEVTAEYPFPILPVHWMSRDPESNDYKMYMFECPNCPKRTMRWGHAHPTWTHHALPFLAELLATQMDMPSHVLNTMVKVEEDEEALNVGLWAVGATKQWCKFDIPFPNLFWKMYARSDVQDLVGCCQYNDAKWYPSGVPLLFYTAHACKNVTETRMTLDILGRLGTKFPKQLFYRGKLRDDLHPGHLEGGPRCML